MSSYVGNESSVHTQLIDFDRYLFENTPYM